MDTLETAPPPPPNAMRFASRVAVVTGGGDGIGRATSLLLAKEGASVVAVDVDGQVASRTSPRTCWPRAASGR